MRKHLACLTAVALLTGCASNGDNSGHTDLYLAVALETAVGTLISLDATGTLPPEGADFISATLQYGAEGCRIVGDPSLDPTTRRAALVTQLADERAAFDAAFSALVEADLDDDVRLAIIPVINGGRAALRVLATTELDAGKVEQPCATVAALAASWDAQQPGETAERG